MGASTVIRDLGNSLKELFKQNIDELTDDSIIFDSPGEIDPANTTGLSVFLYQITENADLKNLAKIMDGPGKLKNPPLYLDLHYLFTPYAQNRETEFIILEGVIKTLYDNPVLGTNILQNSLKDAAQIKAVPHPMTVDELNKLWGTFPNKALRASMAYKITPLPIASDVVTEITRVSEQEIKVYWKE